MHFASTVVRPPYEANSVYLQITSGCSHNACKFCTYYKDAPFCVSPLEEIREDLQELKDTGYSFPRIWLQGADPFLLTYDKLKTVAELIHEYLPFVQSIGGYGRVDSVKNKTVEQIKSLKVMGYNKLVFGIESGDDAVLKRMNKGYEAREIVEQLGKLTQADMDYAVIFLSGLGGHGYGLSHAVKTAEVLNQLTPFRVMAAGLTLFPDTPLMEDVRNGSFVEATEAERIRELQTFLENLGSISFLVGLSHKGIMVQ
ncbi:MAG: radical SAM protein [Selenomonadaceae bacterium]|nr:radical SAM protein [Selenomonadaceae bacterium]